jgi:FkbM family methyltransferase
VDLKTLSRRILPAGVRAGVWYALKRQREAGTSWHGARLREAIWASPGSLVRWRGYAIRIADGPTFYHQYRYIFENGVYHFQAQRSNPVIIDGGSNAGLSILYFKELYPSSRVVAFEPDPDIFAILKENVGRNALGDVTLINAGLGPESGSYTFTQRDADAGSFDDSENGILARMETLSSYLEEPVDFLKLNIEGQELSVLREAEASGRLQMVRQLALEYHDWAAEDQRLAAILDLLSRQGYRYVLRGWEPWTSQADECFPAPWSCLVYARRHSRSGD